MDNILYYGDNLPILRDRNYFKENSVDMIYLDPPFNSQATYNVLFREASIGEKGGGGRSKSQIQAFTDFWTWDEESGKTFDAIITDKTIKPAVKLLLNSLLNVLNKNDMTAYLVMMTARLIEMQKVLKPTGSLYLHCDPTASHYIKLILDAVFGEENFRNEIIWAYRTGGAGKHWFASKHDTIFFYSKSDECKFKPLKERTYYDKPFFNPEQDEEGRYYADVLLRDVLEGEMNIVNEDGKIEVISVKPVLNLSKERLGYPTQKPVGLLEILIRASTEKGDIVLDPFCGCGTTIDASEKLGRNWIGIDITHLAINLIRQRIKARYSKEDIKVIGEPTDLEGAKQLAQVDEERYQFQWWALGLIEAIAVDKKKGADRGIDGEIYYRTGDKTIRTLVQIKSGGVQVKDIRDFAHVIDREKADYGIFITLEEATAPMEKEAVGEGFIKEPITQAQIPKLEIITIKDLLEGKKPKVQQTYTAVNVSYTKAEKHKEKEKPKPFKKLADE
jgi:site-specific DNA-methyltransferase (adenine-specific)